MSSTHIEPSSPPTGVSTETERIRRIESREPRNLAVLCLNQILLRVAWIFKTESVIMPAFLDLIAGAGWVRGCLPALNHLGQSLPPLFFADSLSRLRRKKRALVATTWLMAVPFLVLSLAWFLLDDKRQWWLPAAFLLLYLVFFSMTGLTNLVYGTLQGKLIRVTRRGRLMSLSTTFGAVAAILCAWLLLREWLVREDGGFGFIFGFTGLGFLVAGCVCLLLSEPPDPPDDSQSEPGSAFRVARPDALGRAWHWRPRPSRTQGVPLNPVRAGTARLGQPFRSAWSVFRGDAGFRGVCVTAMLFMSAILLFPHYQALARERLDSQSLDLMVWIIVQNAGAGVFGLASGWLADRCGNRLVVRLQMFAAALVPLTALLLVSLDTLRLYGLAFFGLGLTPVVLKTLSNYTLEFAPPAEHPRYLSTLRLAMAVPFLLSPLVGWLVDTIGFAPVFLAVAAAVAAGGLLTFRLQEPRHVGGIGD